MIRLRADEVRDPVGVKRQDMTVFSGNFFVIGIADAEDLEAWGGTWRGELPNGMRGELVEVVVVELSGAVVCSLWSGCVGDGPSVEVEGLE